MKGCFYFYRRFHISPHHPVSNNYFNDYINFPKDQDSCRAIRLYYTMLYKKFGGDRREQDTDNDALFDAIDDRFEDLNGGF